MPPTDVQDDHVDHPEIVLVYEQLRPPVLTCEPSSTECTISWPSVEYAAGYCLLLRHSNDDKVIDSTLKFAESKRSFSWGNLSPVHDYMVQIRVLASQTVSKRAEFRDVRNRASSDGTKEQLVPSKIYEISYEDSEWSEWYSFATTALATPELRQQHVQRTSFKLAWKPVPGAHSYQLQQLADVFSSDGGNKLICASFARCSRCPRSGV